jgi:hypothetical protein
VSVFVARGGGAGLRPVELAADPRILFVPSPRHASVLLAAGRFPGPLGAALDRVHDQVPAPRAVVWWTADRDAERPAAVWNAVAVTTSNPVDALLAAHRGVMRGDVPSSGGVLADVPPNLFEGRGDHGQGGEGMMGGVPYGRPMAMTADDRDGLALDPLTFTAGPFLVGFPNGLRATVTLQGGVIQQLSLEFLDLGTGGSLDELDAAVVTDRRRRVRWLSESLRLAGLDALAARAARTAAEGGDASVLASVVRRSGLAAAWSGIGTIDGTDARTRLLALLGPTPEETQPRGGPPTLTEVAESLVGADWSDAVVTVCSLGAELERAGEAMATR